VVRSKNHQTALPAPTKPAAHGGNKTPEPLFGDGFALFRHGGRGRALGHGRCGGFRLKEGRVVQVQLHLAAGRVRPQVHAQGVRIRIGFQGSFFSHAFLPNPAPLPPRAKARSPNAAWAARRA
jgi:hypothetical protein